MFENEILKFKALNQLAESDGTVIFGGAEDINIPLGELKQAFALNDKIYNRSIAGLSATDAATVYDEYVAELCPDTIATSQHGVMFSAALKYENFYGTQFHPEKSGDVGERIIENFLKL